MQIIKLLNSKLKSVKLENNQCLKLNYTYNKVLIRLYFDNKFYYYIFLTYQQVSYVNMLPIDGLKMNKNIYLDKLSPNILKQIKNENGKLTDFTNSLKEHILNNNFNIDTYDNDFIQQSSKNKTSKNKGQYIYHLRKSPMGEEQYKHLLDNLHIPKKLLDILKEHNIDIITTDEIYKKRNLQIELQKFENIFPKIEQFFN